MRKLFSVAIFINLFLISSVVNAGSLQIQKVADGVYALVGDLGNRSPENLGNNATFGVIVTNEGVVLIDSGGTYKGAEKIHNAIKSISDKPVKLVINTGGQDHRWLGNGYFKQAGARIIASADAVEDQKARLNDQLTGLENLVGAEEIRGTRDVYADETFNTSLDLDIGGIQLQLRHPGPAHTPGDSYVWLPGKKVVFTGDIVYVDRILGITSVSNSRSWIEVFDQISALEPKHVVPGHGKATTLKVAKADTRDYLTTLRGKIKALVKSGGGMDKVGDVDQSEFKYLENYELLKGRNAERVFLELEWE